MSKRSQEKYREQGLCILCGRRPPRDNRSSCEECSKRNTGCTKKIRNARIAAGKCCVCGERELVTKRHCDDCYLKHKESAKRRYQILRDQVFNAYGSYRCACCGEEEQAFLSIDHINNDGYKHRKDIGQSNCYRWLRDNSFPEGFQVLCMNCQWGRKNCNGICPHQNKARYIPGLLTQEKS